MRSEAPPPATTNRKKATRTRRSGKAADRCHGFLRADARIRASLSTHISRAWGFDYTGGHLGEGRGPARFRRPVLVHRLVNNRGVSPAHDAPGGVLLLDAAHGLRLRRASWPGTPWTRRYPHAISQTEHWSRLPGRDSGGGTELLPVLFGKMGERMGDDLDGATALGGPFRRL